MEILEHVKTKLKKYNEKDKKIISFCKDYTAEIAIITGVTLISGATFAINHIAGMYVLGGILLLGGIFLSIGK